MMTLHRMSAGTGYEYLLQHVAHGDVDSPSEAHNPSRLTEYYAASGYPPGRWFGAGLGGLDGTIEAGDEVTEPQLARLLGEGTDPTSGEPLGRRHRDPTAPGPRASVAGFDLTFSPVKTVSSLWAIAPPEVRAAVWDAHRAAYEQTIEWLEAEVIFTRVGHAGVAQRDVRGVVAAAFDHWDTRAGDPQPHTHVVLANRVQADDGRWRTLDSATLHRAAVSGSEIYDTYLADELTRCLGVDWQPVTRSAGPRGRTTIGWEATGVPAELVAEFSTRSEQIRANLADLVAEFQADRGREPRGQEWVSLRQRATLAERPAKDTPEPLPVLTERWRQRATAALDGADPHTVVEATIDRFRGQLLTAEDLDRDVIAAHGTLAAETTGARRSTWTRWNLLAEAARQSKGLRFVSPAERDRFHDLVADAAERASVSLQPPLAFDVPEMWRRRSGESIFEPHNAIRFTSHAILGAEDALLTGARDTIGPTVDTEHLGAVIAAGIDGQDLADDQASAVRQVTTSRRRTDVLIGPAGTGKTTTLAAVRTAWEAQHGTGTVVGLAPSAASAEVLGDSLGIDAENTAKWLHETLGQGHLARVQATAQARRALTRTSPDRPDLRSRITRRLDDLAAEDARWNLRPGQLLIVDEASMAGTVALAALARHAHRSGAKVLLVGDPMQLGAVESGGALRLLAHDIDAATLTGVHRFTNPWERRASTALRVGRTSALDTYERHGRITGGDRTTTLDTAYQAWLDDTRQGRTSLLIAADNATVTALNTRARLDLVDAGTVEADGVALHDGTTAGRGDRIVTRANDRTLANPSRWVRNGDTWTVLARHSDGALAVISDDHRHRIHLPSEYVADNVQLAYATTAHRAQGATVDTAHAIVSDAIARETLYVAMTRGRHTNHAYVVVDTHDDDHGHTLTADTPRALLEGVLARTDADLSATETLRAAYASRNSLAWLVPVYDEMATSLTDHHLRVRLSPALAGVDHAPTDAAARLAASPGWARLVGLARRHGGLDTDTLSAAVARVDWTDPDPANRLADSVASITPPGRAGHIAGTAVAHPGIGDHATDTALRDVASAITTRAHALADTAHAEQHPWTRHLGPAPTTGPDRDAWYDALVATAAYRDQWAITDHTPLGDEVADPRQAAHRRRVAHQLDALNRADAPSTTAGTATTGPTPQRHGAAR